MEWIAFTVFAAAMQAVRTAGQKKMATRLNALSATWARYGFGLPIALVYVLICFIVFDRPKFYIPPVAWVYIVVGSLSQLAATLLLVRLLKLRNFAVGTTYAKSEAVLAAVLAVVFFARDLNTLAWLAIFIGVLGIVVISWEKKTRVSFSWSAAIQGIGAGLGFATTAVLVREATATITAPVIVTAASILAISIFVQLMVCTVLLIWYSPNSWGDIRNHKRTGWFIGITGVLGSIGWFTAFGFQEAALVKTLGQSEFLFTVLLTVFYFKERIRKIEWLGMMMILSSVILVVLA